MILCRFCGWRLNGLEEFGWLHMTSGISQLFEQALSNVNWAGSLTVILLMITITMVGYRINHPIL
jgi:hypothetical protein